MSAIRNQTGKVIFSLALLALAGCALQGPRLEGSTVTSAQLQHDTFKLLRTPHRAFTGCGRIDSARTRIISLPLEAETSSRGHVLRSEPVIERWTLSGCGKESDFLVTFTPDGVGGAFISARLLPDATTPAKLE